MAATAPPNGPLGDMKRQNGGSGPVKLVWTRLFPRRRAWKSFRRRKDKRPFPCRAPLTPKIPSVLPPGPEGENIPAPEGTPAVPGPGEGKPAEPGMGIPGLPPDPNIPSPLNPPSKKGTEKPDSTPPSLDNLKPDSTKSQIKVISPIERPAKIAARTEISKSAAQGSRIEIRNAAPQLGPAGASACAGKPVPPRR